MIQQLTEKKYIVLYLLLFEIMSIFTRMHNPKREKYMKQSLMY